MTDQHSINIISNLLQSPETPSTGDNEILAKLFHKYPYFVPVRYIKAAEQYRNTAFSNEMLSSAYPYTGNWIQFWEYVQGIESKTEVAETSSVDPLEFHADFENDSPGSYPPEEAATINDSSEIDEPTAINEKLEVAAPILAEEEPITDLNITLTEEDVPAETEQPVVPEMPVAVDHTGEQDAEEVTIESVDTKPPVIVEELGARVLIETEETQDIIQEKQDEQKEVQQTEPIFSPVSSEDYFMQQGIKISGEMPQQVDELIAAQVDARDKSLMVMMSFTEWLLHFKHSSDKQKSEAEDQKAVKTMWQKEKLAAALEEENDEIPENVFEMAVNSITREEGLASESLADIYIKQGKYDKAVEMYRKLSLRNPQKNAYFARKIEEILKDKHL